MEVKYGTSARISKPALAVALSPFSLVLPAAYARAPLGLFFFIFDRIHSHLDVNLKAASYYDRHNPHMRGLNAHNTWRSDWDPTTSLKYIVRKDHGLNQTIPPFDPTDEPAIERTESEVRIEIRWLR